MEILCRGTALRGGGFETIDDMWNPSSIVYGIIFTLSLVTCKMSESQQQVPAHLELSTIDKEDNFLYAKCNDEPILHKSSLIESAPVRAEIKPEATFQVFDNITGYRFTNPAGVTYDGIAAHSEGLMGTVSMVPSVPVKEHSWFAGYSWRIVYVIGCEDLQDSHIGWAFFCAEDSCISESRSQSALQVREPDFVFFIVWSSVNNPSSASKNGKKNSLILAGNKRRNLTMFATY